MGRMNSLGAFNRSVICEVARMSYGSRKGVAGGTGHIGLLDGDGRTRIVKFDTHGGTSSSDKAKESSDKLRNLLAKITKESGLSPAEKNRILELLLMDKKNAKNADKPLLERKITAKVVEKLGGFGVWKQAGAGVKSGYSSSKSAKVRTYEDAIKCPAEKDTVNVRTVKCDSKEKEVDSYEEARNEINAFRKFASKHTGYVRFDKTGKRLEGAGLSIGLRSDKAKVDNNEVHQRLWDSINTYYGGKMPDDVKKAMSGFKYDGKPLSTKEVRAILDAVDDNPVDDNPVDTNPVDNNPVDNGAVDNGAVGGPKRKEQDLKLLDVLANLQKTLGLKELPYATVGLLGKALEGVRLPSQAAAMIVALSVEEGLHGIGEDKMLFLLGCCRQFLDCRKEAEIEAGDVDFIALLAAKVNVLKEKIGMGTPTKEKIASALMGGQGKPRVKGGYNKLTNAQFVALYDKHQKNTGRSSVNGKAGQNDVLSEVQNKQKNLKKVNGIQVDKTQVQVSPGDAIKKALKRQNQMHGHDEVDDEETIQENQKRFDEIAAKQGKQDKKQEARANLERERKLQFKAENAKMRKDVTNLNLPKVKKAKGGTFEEQLKNVKLVKTQKVETKKVVEEKSFLQNALSLAIKNWKALEKGDENEEDDDW